MTSDTADRTDQTTSTSRTVPRGTLLDPTFYQAWALDAEGAWRYLPIDAGPDTPADPPGATWRERVKDGALRCPYPDCDTAFTGIRRGAGRVAFVHPKTGASHTDKKAKETLWRLAAVQAVLRWVAYVYPGATATTDAADLAVRPDVFVGLAGGTRIAVECRYAALGADEWRERHEAYAAAGVEDVWLFAHAGPYARKASGDAGRLRPPAPLADLLDGEATVAWLNPFLGLVGVPDGVEDDTVALRTLPIAEWTLPAGHQPTAPAAAVVATDAAGSTAAGSVDTAGSADSTQTADGAGTATVGEDRPAPGAGHAPTDAGATGDTSTADGGQPFAPTPGTARQVGADPAGTHRDAARPAATDATPASGPATAAASEPAAKPAAAGSRPGKEADVAADESSAPGASGAGTRPAHAASPDEVAAPDAGVDASDRGTAEPVAPADAPPADAPPAGRPATDEPREPVSVGAERAAGDDLPGTRRPGWLRRVLDRFRRSAA